MADGPGTYLEADNTPVSTAAAQTAWADAARETLIGVARRYHGLITYGELAAAVQADSGVRTRQLMQYWIGGVLTSVSATCAAKGEPMLSALCVHQNGTVGPGYGNAVTAAEGTTPEDLDKHAAQQRFECHRFFGADLPSDGGRAVLTPQVAARRERLAKANPPVRPVCPTCYTQLPATGICDQCR